MQDPPIGQFSEGPDCGEKCVSYIWTGDLAVNQVVTITTIEGQSSVGGEEGTHYTATVVMTDQLGAFNTPLYTATVTGTITHFPNLIPSKSAPEVIGAGQVMTYMLQVYNSGLSTDESAFPPVLTDTVPASTTLVRVNDGGKATSTGAGTVVSWELPSMSPGDRLYRSFAVQVDPSLVSGTLIINRDYAATWYSSTLPTSNWGDPVTTTVREVGLIAIPTRPLRPQSPVQGWTTCSPIPSTWSIPATNSVAGAINSGVNSYALMQYLKRNKGPAAMIQPVDEMWT